MNSKTRNNFPLVKEKSIEFREYQVKIALQCSKRNSLVVLPTGLGKTIIMILTISKILESEKINQKIVILAPTKPLINQHYKLVKKTLKVDEDMLIEITGKVSPEKRAKIFRNHEILFYTPQTLRNDLLQERYNLKNVQLLVFDEAHHALGDHSYCIISDIFAKQNPSGLILALTASPGASKKRIHELCKNLHVPLENIIFRLRNDVDVKNYIQPLDIIKIGVNLTELMDDSISVLNSILEERLKYLNQIGFLKVQGNDKLYNNVFRKDLLLVKKELTQKLKENFDKTTIYRAISINAQALILFHMLDLIEQQGLDVFLDYLKIMFKDSIKKSASKAIKALASDYRLRIILTRLNDYKNISENFLIHPKFNVMKEIIINNLLKNKDSKILVFVKFRNSVQNIMNKLKNISLIRPARFVGQATKNNEDKGLTQNMQLKILNGFKSGKYNVLISEIRYIQRKGRTARQRPGKVFILYSKNTRDEVYLKILDNKTKKMFINLKNKNFINSTKEKITKTSKNRINLESFIDERKKENIITVNENLVIISKDFPNKLMLESFFKKNKFQVKISGKGAIIKIHDRHVIKLLTPALDDIPNFLNNLKNEINQLLTVKESLILLLDMSRNKEYIEIEKSLRMFIQDNFSSNKIKFFTINIPAELNFILKRLLFTFK